MRRAFYAFIRRKPMRKGLCIPELNTGPLDLVPLNAGVCWPDAALCRWRPALSAAGSFAPPSPFSERKQAVWQRRASPQGEARRFVAAVRRRLLRAGAPRGGWVKSTTSFGILPEIRPSPGRFFHFSPIFSQIGRHFSAELTVETCRIFEYYSKGVPGRGHAALPRRSNWFQQFAVRPLRPPHGGPHAGSPAQFTVVGV